MQDESGNEEDSDSNTDSEEGDYFDTWDGDYPDKPDKRRFLNLASSRAESIRLAREGFIGNGHKVWQAKQVSASLP